MVIVHPSFAGFKVIEFGNEGGRKGIPIFLNVIGIYELMNELFGLFLYFLPRDVGCLKFAYCFRGLLILFLSKQIS